MSEPAKPTALESVEQTLIEVNKIVTLINPLAGIVTTTGTFLIDLARKAGVDRKQIEAYATALSQFQADELALRQAIDDFRQKYPVTPGPSANGA
jgi:hypothetical protein